MELGSQQNPGVLVNRTRAVESLSQLLDNSRSTIIKVEVLVTLAASQLFLQLVLGTWKRSWHNSFVSGALSVCNASLLPLVFYTLSIMQSSPVNSGGPTGCAGLPLPVKNSMYPVWGASLLMAAGGSIVVSQFNHDENVGKEMIQKLTVMARYVFYLLMLVMLMSPYSLKESLTRPWQKTHNSASSGCMIGLLMFICLTKGIETVGFSFVTKLLMKGADYPVGDRKRKAYPVGYAIRHPVQVITIDQIWGSCGDLHHGETLEEVSLSLALCQSLIPRFRGFSVEKARLPATHDSVFNELLQTGRYYERLFRIIDVELVFCYDYFFTKYYSIYFGMMVHFPLFLCRLSFLTLVLVYTVQGSVAISTPNPIIQVQITRADHIITLVLLGTALVVELLQGLVYLTSDWIKLSLACHYVKHKPNAFLKKLIVFFSRVTIFSLRRNRIAQNTVILPDKFFSKCNLDPVEISPETKKAVVGSIKPAFVEQPNRLASRMYNSIFDHWILQDHWTLRDCSQVEVMLIWHIATDYCHLATDYCHLSPSYAGRPTSMPVAQRAQLRLMRDLEFINGKSSATDAAVTKYIDSFGQDLPVKAIKALRTAARLDDIELCRALDAIAAELGAGAADVP